MKELSIEQKAKRYDEAIERVKKWHNAPNIDKMPTYGNRIIEEIFPELKESEDEKIRKALIRFHKSTIDVDGIKGEDILAWLEKQGEQKPADWSEEDECCINQLIIFCENCMQQDSEAIRCANWLKSLKFKNQWKPSEEQMKALNFVINLMASSASPAKNDYYYNVFKDLRKQLKKLMEE